MAKFAGTRAEQRAQAIETAARDRATALLKTGKSGFDKEIAAIAVGWNGLSSLAGFDGPLAAHQGDAALIADYRGAVSARRSKMVASLTDSALDEIAKAGNGYKDIDRVNAISQGFQRQFVSFGVGTVAGPLKQAADARETLLIQASLAPFKADIKKRANTRDDAAALLAVAAKFDERAAKRPGFKAYAEAARRRSDEMLTAVCDAAFEKAAIPDAISGLMILGAAEDMPPRDFVCGLGENGHAVISIEERPAQDGADTTYLMRIDQADDLYAHVVLRNLEALPGKTMLVGVELGDASKLEAISIDRWRAYAARLLDVAPPAGVAQRGAPTPPTTSRADKKEITDMLEASTVFLVVIQGKSAKVGSGTGFFIGPDLILTNQHVVKRSSDAIHVFSRIVGWKRAELVVGSGMTGHAGVDAAVLRVRDYRSEEFLKLSQSFAMLEDLVIAGYPGVANDNDKGYQELWDFIVRRYRGENVPYRPGMAPTIKFAAGQLQSFYPNESGYEVLQHGAQTAPGNSGSAIVNLCGDVIGLHYLGASGGGTKYNYAYSVNEIDKFLRQHRIEFQANATPCKR